MNDLVLITFTILLPLTPAYILYKALPAETSVTGPFQGLNIQLSGAFAGYFLLVLVIIGFISSRPKPREARYEVWKVTGNMNLDKSWTAVEREKLQFLVVPGKPEIERNGDFQMLVASEVCEDGKLKFPKVLIQRDGYETATINLDGGVEGSYGQLRQEVTKNFLTRDLQVKTQIELRPEMIPYNGDNAQSAQPAKQQTGGQP